jgi:hypothetical protein
MARGVAGMYKSDFMRVVALGAFAVLCLGITEVSAAGADISKFVAACTADPSITDDPGFDDGKVTPKAFCECVAGELAKNNLGQKDVDMLTKMHNEEISDEDVAGYPTLEDLLNKNEGFEDNCRKSLGIPTDNGTDTEEEPTDEDAMPNDEEAPPADDNASPPE